MIEEVSRKLMCKKILTYLPVIILIGFLIYFQYYKINVNKLLSHYDYNLEECSISYSKLNMFKSDFSSYLKSENYPIDPNILLTSHNGERVMFKDVVKGDVKLIVRFSYLNCEACIESQFNVLDEFVNRFNKHDVLILASYDNLRDVRLFYKFKNSKFEIYNVESEVLKQMDRKNEPYFFIIDHSMNSRFVFTPHKEMLEFSRMYLTSICDRYFDNRK